MSVFFINPFLGAVGGDFESIATVTVGSGGAASAVFDNIPGTYQHLQVRGVVRSSRTGSSTDSITASYNADTSSANYVRFHVLDGNGASASASAQASGVAAHNIFSSATAASATASIFEGVVMDILDYASSSKYKTVRSFSGHDRNGAGAVNLWSALWMSNSAITKITITCTNNLVEYTTFALYGIKAP